MPELPEVETIVRQLRKEIKGRRFTSFRCNHPKMLVGHSVSSFRTKIKRRRILDVQRRGKIILCKLSGGLTLAMHLRLSGQLFLRNSEDPPDRFNHAKLGLGENLELRFNDLRKFGQFWLIPQKELKQNFDQIQKLGIDPLTRNFTFAHFKKILAGKSTKIKALLMDQTKISGIGNIYSDEALFRAGIQPRTPAQKISRQRLQKLYHAIQTVLKEGIRHQGTSVQSYRETHGQKGQHQNYLKVYHRTGKPCPKCGTKIERLKIGGRSAHFCPRCQK